MKKVRGEEGAALVTALLLTFLSLVISTTLLYTVTLGAKGSASHKRYSTALAAAQGGVEVFAKEIVPRLFGITYTGTLTKESLDKVQDSFSFLSLSFPEGGEQCLQQKLTRSTEGWSACEPAASSGEPATMPDLTFTLQGTAPSREYRVSAKIVDTMEGNSHLGGIELDAGGAVDWRDEGIYPEHVPYLYSIGVQGETRMVGEKARLSVLYAY